MFQEYSVELLSNWFGALRIFLIPWKEVHLSLSSYSRFVTFVGISTDYPDFWTLLVFLPIFLWCLKPFRCPRNYNAGLRLAARAFRFVELDGLEETETRRGRGDVAEGKNCYHCEAVEVRCSPSFLGRSCITPAKKNTPNWIRSASTYELPKDKYCFNRFQSAFQLVEATLHRNLSLICYKAADFEPALEHAEASLKAEPWNVKSKYRRALALCALKRFQEAQEDLKVGHVSQLLEKNKLMCDDVFVNSVINFHKTFKFL